MADVKPMVCIANVMPKCCSWKTTVADIMVTRYAYKVWQLENLGARCYGHYVVLVSVEDGMPLVADVMDYKLC